MRDCVQPYQDEDDWYSDEDNMLTVEEILKLEEVEFKDEKREKLDVSKKRITTGVSPHRTIPQMYPRYRVHISPGLKLLEEHQRDRRRGSVTSDEGEVMDLLNGIEEEEEEEDEEMEEEKGSFCMFDMEL